MARIPRLFRTPVVTAITCIGQTLMNTNTVQFSLVFDKSVSGVESTDFSLVGGPSGTIASVSGSGASYTVTVSGISGSGTLGLELLAGNTIVDTLGTPLAATSGFVSQTYTIDRQLFLDGGSGTLDNGL